MKRWLVRVAAALFAAAVVITGLAWLTLRASLPQLDGEVFVAGITAPVSIVRDAAGIPTITAQNRSDLAYALGYAHGQDRFFRMDLVRRDAAGELSAIIGPATVGRDRRQRLHRFRSRAEAALRAMTAFERQVLQSYAEGVNAGLDSLDAQPFEYYFLGVEPEPWRAEDCMLVAYAMFVNLNDERAEKDQQRGVIAAVLPADVVAWIDPLATPWDAPLLGEVPTAAAIPGPERINLRNTTLAAREFAEAGPPPVLGSNNWAVSGALTTSGRALVSNDMHLGLNVPTIYYRARLVMTGDDAIDVSGVTLPGQPQVIAGSNGHIAWGYTNSNGDWSDAVQVFPGATPGTYRTPDGDVPYTKYVERITVKDGKPVEMEVRETIWGPIDDDPILPGSEVAISWIAHHTEASNLGIMQLETAQTVAAALDIANRIVMPPQNFVVGDEHGDIGWTISGQIPLRGDFDPRLPADWSKQHGWQGWLPAGDYPRVVNPPDGRIWTANSRVIDGAQLQVLGNGGYAFGQRTRQIRDALQARQSFAPEDMLAIQNDDRALFLAGWQSLLVDLLKRNSETASDLDEYRELVSSWIPRAVPESVGYRLVRAFRNEVRRRMSDALLAPVRERFGGDIRLGRSRQFDAPLWSIVSEQPEHLLPANFATWDEFLLEAVRAANTGLLKGRNGTLAERSWGEFNAASIRHPFSNSLPRLSGWLDMPADPLRGDADMPRAQGPDWGASERFSVAPGDEANGLLHMPGGQSGHPLSDFYRAGHAAWVSGEATPFLPGIARHELILQPVTR